MARILIIDDNEGMRMFVAFTLKSKGMEVREAATGDEALEILGQDNAFDLIICDVIMPGLDGMEFKKRLNADESLKDVPVLMMTALNTFGIKQAGRVLGAADHLSKPFEPEELMEKVTKLLGTKPQSSA